MNKTPVPFAPDRPIQLELLGGVDLRGTPKAPDLVAQNKAFAFLSHLALARPHGFLRRDLVATMFWPENSTKSARDNLRKLVLAVRDALGHDVILARGDEEFALNRDLVWCDAVAMEAATAADALARALELYRGPLMPGFFADAPGFERWLDEERTHFQRLAGSTAWTLAKRFEKDQDLTMATRWARKAATLSQHEERVVRNAMLLLDRAGARADALKVYEDFARRVKLELDAEPSAETKSLADSLRGS